MRSWDLPLGPMRVNDGTAVYDVTVTVGRAAVIVALVMPGKQAHTEL